MGVGQIEINGDGSGAGPQKFIDCPGDRGSRPGPPSDSLKGSVVDVHHDDLGRHGIHISWEMPLFEVEYLFVPTVESAAEINQDDEQRGDEGGEEDFGIGSAAHVFGDGT